MFESLIGPFIEYGFMRKALTGGVIVSVGAVPVGIFMTLRRMSLTGDAMAHAILPGAAIAYLISGLSLFGLTVGGKLPLLPHAAPRYDPGGNAAAAQRHAHKTRVPPRQMLAGGRKRVPR